MSLWATKSIAALRAEADATGERSLKRTLSALNLTMLGIGAIIGAGIFVLTGLAAALHAGPAVPLSFVVAGIACGFAGLCYAEFARDARSRAAPTPTPTPPWASSSPGSSAGTWCSNTPWAPPRSAVGWSGYLVSLLDYLGIHLPTAITSAPLRFCSAADVTNAVDRLRARGLEPHRIAGQPSGDGDRAPGHGDPRDRHRGIGQGQQPHRHSSRSPSSCCSSSSGCATSTRQLASLHPAQHRPVRPVRLERHVPGRRASSSSPTSDSTPSPPRRRRPRTRSATCRSASSARSSSAPSSTSLVALVLTGIVNYNELNVPATRWRSRSSRSRRSPGCARSSRSARSRGLTRSCWSCSWASPASSTRWRATGCCRRCSARCIPVPHAVLSRRIFTGAHRGDRRRHSSRSGSWASWCPSARCSPS